MSIASSARASSIMSNVSKGSYIRQSKFANYGAVVEDSIKAQQRQADRRLLQIQAGKVKSGIVNGIRHQEARDSNQWGSRMSVGHKSNAIAKKTFCSTTA